MSFFKGLHFFFSFLLKVEFHQKFGQFWRISWRSKEGGRGSVVFFQGYYHYYHNQSVIVSPIPPSQCILLWTVIPVLSPTPAAHKAMQSCRHCMQLLHFLCCQCCHKYAVLQVRQQFLCLYAVKLTVVTICCTAVLPYYWYETLHVMLHCGHIIDMCHCM